VAQMAGGTRVRVLRPGEFPRFVRDPQSILLEGWLEWSLYGDFLVQGLAVMSRGRGQNKQRRASWYIGGDPGKSRHK